jgi:hypothetical protein
MFIEKLDELRTRMAGLDGCESNVTELRESDDERGDENL